MDDKIINWKIECKLKDLRLDIEGEVKSYNFKDQPTERIIKALNECGVDNKGVIWINENKIMHIIRNRSKKDSMYELRNLKTKDKITYEDEKYVNLAPVMEILTRKANKNANDKKLECIIMILTRAQFDDVVQFRRLNYQKIVDSLLGDLGKRRCQNYKIVEDELTGKTLNKKYEFHHIRPKAIVGNEIYQLDIELGLVLNCTTHKKITAANIKDEDELYVFCKSNGYKTNWYIKVKEELKKYK